MSFEKMKWEAVGLSHLPEGMECYRESFRFGNVKGYRSKEGVYLFSYRLFGESRYVSGQDLYNVLLGYWRPASLSDQDYFITGMPDLKGLPVPKEYPA
jgi:hypothetical protein